MVPAPFARRPASIDYKQLPKEPGVYLFKDKDGAVIYVGKAKSLRSRVSSYFSGKDRSVKTQHLAARIAAIDRIIVNNEVEALLLENRLIKQHKPKYNIMLKDAKTYAYIKVTDERFPRVLSTRLVTKKGTYFGPYTDGSARAELVKLTNALFKLRTSKTVCKRACLNVHLGLCSGPCVGRVTPEEYHMQIEEAKAFLRGETAHIVERLTREMRAASQERRYEIAIERRRQLEAIEHLHEKQRVDVRRTFDQDIVAIIPAGAITKISLFHIVKGIILGREEHRFETQEGVLRSLVTQYYATRAIPSEIIVNEPCWEDEEEKQALEAYFTSLKRTRVALTLPQQGPKKELLLLAEKNARQSDDALLEIGRKLGLPGPPRIIECFDISNLGREHIVAGMVRFVDGKPDKAGYRRFAMRTVVGKNDDFASMHEAVHRRYSRLKAENAELPDLILIDGGAGQLSAALSALRESRVDLFVAALAKQEEELYLPGAKEPLRLPKNGPEMLLLRGIRDSVHRYAISYNRKKRSMALREQLR